MNFKNYKKASTILLVVAFMGLITLNSCNKEQYVSESVKQTVTTKPVTEMTDKEIEIKIKDFISKAESNEKTTEIMSLEDAIWNIEAALNYSFCINKVELVADYTETMEFSIIDNNGKVNFNEVANVFTNLKAKTAELKKKAQYISVIDVDEVKGVINLSISKEVSDNKTLVYQVFGDWYYGEDYGKCDGTLSPRDATTEIESCLHHQFVFPYGTYFTGPFVDIMLVYIYYPTGNALDNYRDYRLFCRETQYNNFDYCIDVEDANWYANNYYNLMLSENGTGYTPVGDYINVIDLKHTDNNNNVIRIFHNLEYKTGIKHYSDPNIGM